jgi:hypothetical protein
MAFLASLVAYLSTVTIVAVGLIISFAALLGGPDPSAIAPQTAALSKPSAAIVAAAATTNSTKVTPASAPGRPSITRARAEDKQLPQIKSAADARHKTRVAKETWKDKDAWRAEDLPRLFRQQLPNRWAYQQAPNFATRYLGYVDDPAADQTEVR